MTVTGHFSVSADKRGPPHWRPATADTLDADTDISTAATNTATEPLD